MMGFAMADVVATGTRTVWTIKNEAAGVVRAERGELALETVTPAAAGSALRAADVLQMACGEVRLAFFGLPPGGRIAEHAVPAIGICQVVGGSGRLILPKAPPVPCGAGDVLILYEDTLHAWEHGGGDEVFEMLVAIITPATGEAKGA